MDTVGAFTALGVMRLKRVRDEQAGGEFERVMSESLRTEH